MRKIASALAGGVAALGMMMTAASANTTVRAGTLECDLSGGIGLVFVEKQTMTCTFKGAHGGPPDIYTGKLDEVGITLGATAGGVMVWAVLAAQHSIPQGALAGTYAGLTANASIGVGGGANVLIGGTGRSFVLQPISLEGQVGINVAGGVTTLTLTPAN
ncbi:MAG: DUF992 domain-containing protein [Rhizobiales bacterium]|nr:DUF992 domain-containing protein [Hyphomicrobiales bacterium]